MLAEVAFCLGHPSSTALARGAEPGLGPAWAARRKELEAALEALGLQAAAEDATCVMGAGVEFIYIYISLYIRIYIYVNTYIYICFFFLIATSWILGGGSFWRV